MRKYHGVFSERFHASASLLAASCLSHSSPFILILLLPSSSLHSLGSTPFHYLLRGGGHVIDQLTAFMIAPGPAGVSCIFKQPNYGDSVELWMWLRSLYSKADSVCPLSWHHAVRWDLIELD